MEIFPEITYGDTYKIINKYFPSYIEGDHASSKTLCLSLAAAEARLLRFRLTRSSRTERRARPDPASDEIIAGRPEMVRPFLF